MQAFVTGNLAVLEELLEGLARLVGSIEDDVLNWTPLASESNSVAALVVHIVGSLDSWTARAVDEPVNRDRDAEFRASRSAGELVDSIDRARTTLRRRFARLESIDPAALRHVARLGLSEEQDVSVAWCIEHAVIHTGEHWGQIQLTVQIQGTMAPANDSPAPRRPR